MRKILLYFFTLIILLIIIGFVKFLITIQYKDARYNKQSDGIAVLTGGKGRIKLGLDLLKANNNIKLIISGVDKKVSELSILPENLKNKDNIVLDKDSESTYQNSIIIADWIEKNNLSDITVITSYYHMPRSMLLLETLAAKYNFYPLPVKKNNEKDLNYKKKMLYYFFLIEEYIKYLLSHVLILLK
jgi:uncharacterized SAM-binding protein YcdF (DUF218 family)